MPKSGIRQTSLWDADAAVRRGSLTPVFFKMRKFNFRKVLDGLTASSPGSGSGSGSNSGGGSGSVHPGGTAGVLREEIQETLTSEYFHICKTVRHGFPYQPTALAFDPVQKTLAIGTRTGAIRILGRPGVDCYCQHESGAAVLQLQFLINEGALVSASSDDTLHLWNLRQKRPAILHSLKFNRERVNGSMLEQKEEIHIL